MKTALRFRLMDIVGAALLLMIAFPMKLVVRRRYWLPAFTRMQDRLGLHLRDSHYYEPTYREADLPAVTGVERNLPGLDLNEAGQLALLERFNFAEELRAIPAVKPSEAEYGYTARMFGPGDAEAAYSMVRLFKPARVIEIGCGDSTLIMRDAIARNKLDDPVYVCRQLCIEPYEKPWLESIGVEVMRQRVEEVDLSVFTELKANDILFIDSSHVIRPWGDVLRELLEIVPVLAPGVLVHVHDIYTPRDYPEAYLRQQRRMWNEQYLLEAYLTQNTRVEIICALNWLKHNHHDRFAGACPIAGSRPETEPGAFWFATKA